MERHAEEINLEQYFREYYARLVYFAFQIVHDRDSAEDIVQETFVKFWDQRDELKIIKVSVKSLLFSMVKNASLNVLRHQQVEEKFMLQQEVGQTEDKTIVQALIQSEVFAHLYQAIESLPEGCRKISRLSFLEEKKNQEIAQELGISVNTVKTQKQRGLQLLRLRLRPEVWGLLLLPLLD